MRLLIIAAAYKPSYVYGGPTYSVTALCEALVREGQDVTVMTTNANGHDDFQVKDGEEILVEGVKVVYYSRWSGDPWTLCPTLTWAVWRNVRKFDVIHIHGWWNWVAMVSFLIARLSRRPTVLTPRGTLGQYSFRTQYTSVLKQILHAGIFRPFMRRALIHVTSEGEYTDVRKLLPSAHILSIPNIIDLPELRTSKMMSNGALKLVFLGRIHPVKNLEFVLDILNGVSFNWTLQIIGDGDPHYIQTLKSLSIHPERISWPGSKLAEDKFKQLAEADVLVLLSHSENFGNSVIEALSQATPVLISDRVGLASWVAGHQLGWVIPLDRQAGIYTLETIHGDRANLRKTGDRGPVILKQTMSPTVLAQRYIQECYA